MKYYLKLQYTRLRRWLKYIGINPIVGLGLGFVVFVGLSALLFYKTEYAKWIYLALALSTALKLSEKSRNTFLALNYSRLDYRRLRIVENGIIVLPFLIYLLVETELLVALALAAGSVLIAFYKINRMWHRTIPTPFRKFPFEYIIGFRKTFWLVGVAYFLVFKAIQVDNYILGLAGMVLIFFCGMSFYQKPEKEYFVWIYKCNAKEFLKRKVLTSLVCGSILSILALVGVLIGFPNDWSLTLIVYLVGHIFLTSMILAKYSSFPREMSVPQGVFYAISLLFPPMLLIAIWIFYNQSKKRLEPILG